MVSLTIDGQSIKTEEGTTILEAAQSANIYIPTLCYHPLLQPYSACRLCVVEINAGGRPRIVTSCNYYVEEGLEVKTDSPTVVEARKMLIELLLARAPKARVVQTLAQKYGVEQTQLKVRDEGELCILCGRCAQLCSEIVGVSAINFINKGTKREVAFTPEISSEICVGCGLCAAICPTNALELPKPYGIIAAIAMGRQAATSIDEYLGGNGIIDEPLTEVASPDPWLGRTEGFACQQRILMPNLPAQERCDNLTTVELGFSKEMAVKEAERCLHCDLRLQISAPPLPPEEWLRFEESQVGLVPETEGVVQLLDEGKEILYIKGAMNMRQELEEQLNASDKAYYFLYQEEPMYTMRESELLQQFTQKYHREPELNTLDDLF